MSRDESVLLDAEIEAELASDEGETTRALLARGRPVHIRRDDTPSGVVIRVHPDGHEELIHLDREALASILG